MTNNGGTMQPEDRAEALSAFAEVIAALDITASINTSSPEAGNALLQIGAAVEQLRVGLDLCGNAKPVDLVELYKLVRAVHLGLELEHTFELSRGMRIALRVELGHAQTTIEALSAAANLAA